MANLLILTQPMQKLIANIPKVLELASSHSAKQLYIHLDNGMSNCLSSRNTPSSQKRHLISKIYSIGPALCPGVDIRVLLSGFKFESTFQFDSRYNTSKVLIDYSADVLECNIRTKYSTLLNSELIVLLDKIDGSDIINNAFVDFQLVDSTDHEIYEEVVLGGTFDRLHSGHKILLSEGVLRCKKRLTVGVADGPLLKRKILKELILPCQERIECVKNFLNDIDPTLTYTIERITDPIGPAGTDKRLQLLVVSEETKKGIDIINNYRKDKGLSQLNHYCIQLFNDNTRENVNEERKFSSSSERMRALGSRIRVVEANSRIPDSPYIVGLTGGIASGKTSIAKRLQDLGAVVIDCDKLGHKTYGVGTSCYRELVQYFGKCLLNERNEIDRKKLGAIVFNDKEQLRELNNIVWPHIANLVEEEVQIQRSLGQKCIILDAAVLLEANWDSFCHEIWVCLISQEEAVSRIVDRDGLCDDAATSRVNSQMTNEERLSKAHIVFCSFWDREYTHSQVKKAWGVLQSEGKL